MDYLFAPMEGITSASYRKVHHGIFGGEITYFSPFIAPDREGSFKNSYLRDIMPDGNEGIKLVPQLLVNAPEPFLIVAQKLSDIGYGEVNLNAGCPSGTVFSKHKGSGMLSDRDSLRRTLDAIFEKTPVKVSIKTRMGVESTAEFPEIMEIYRQYPFKSVIIHARAKSGMYKSVPDIRGFAEAAANCPFRLYYNGNIFSRADLDELTACAGQPDGVMLGRGAVANPALFRTLSGGPELTRSEIIAYHDENLDAMRSAGLFDSYAMNRMKEIWSYMICMFPGSEKQFKALNKCRSLPEYISAANSILHGCDFQSAAFRAPK